MLGCKVSPLVWSIFIGQNADLTNGLHCTKIVDALEFAKIHIFGIGIHHTSRRGIRFAWTLSVVTLIFVKATREQLHFKAYV